jgi:hypothetical protein
LQNDQSRLVELLVLVAPSGKLKPVFPPSSLVKPSPDIIAQSTKVRNMAVSLCRKDKAQTNEARATTASSSLVVCSFTLG